MSDFRVLFQNCIWLFIIGGALGVLIEGLWWIPLWVLAGAYDPAMGAALHDLRIGLRRMLCGHPNVQRKKRFDSVFDIWNYRRFG